MSAGEGVTFQDTDPSTPPNNTIVSADLIGGAYYQRVKITWGVDGTANDASAASPLPVDGSGVTQPVSGTVTANQGGTWNITNITGTISLPTGAALDATLTGGTQKTKLVDTGGTNVASISAAGAVKVDASSVAVPITDNSGSLTVDNGGTFAVQAAQSGTWNIGTVTTVTTVAAVTAISNALPAGTNTIGKTFAAPQTTKALTNASVSASSSGENTLVSGTASQTIRVFRGSFTAASAVTLTFKDAAGGATLGVVPLTANGSFSFDTMDSGEPLWVTASAGAFILSLSAAVSVSGFVQYTKS